MTMYYVALACFIVGIVAIFIKRTIIKYLGIALLVAAVILVGCNWYINGEDAQPDIIVTPPPQEDIGELVTVAPTIIDESDLPSLDEIVIPETTEQPLNPAKPNKPGKPDKPWNPQKPSKPHENTSSDVIK